MIKIRVSQSSSKSSESSASLALSSNRLLKECFLIQISLMLTSTRHLTKMTQIASVLR